jgi:hypothetical protein
MTVQEVEVAFRKMSSVAIAVIALITTLCALDIIFGLRWGYSIYDLKLGAIVLAFAFVLRIIGLKVISFVGGA